MYERDDKCVNLKGRDHSEVLGIEGRVILEWI
jgi:hypothetical protein